MAFRVYEESLVMVRLAYRAAAVMEAKDPDLARQLRRSASSVPLNVGEGNYSRKGNRALRFHSALGSANEARCTVEVGQAVGLLGAQAELLGRLDHIVAMLWKLTR